MVQPRVRVVGTPDHQDGDAVLRLDRLQDRLALVLQVGVDDVHRLHALHGSEVALVFGHAQQRAPGREQLALQQRRLGERQRRIDVGDAAVGEEVVSS